jgi:hypothetical protein
VLLVDVPAVIRDHRLDVEQREGHRPPLPVRLGVDGGKLGHVVGGGGDLLGQLADLVFDGSIRHGRIVPTGGGGRTSAAAIGQASQRWTVTEVYRPPASLLDASSEHVTGDTYPG